MLMRISRKDLTAVGLERGYFVPKPIEPERMPSSQANRCSIHPVQSFGWTWIQCRGES
jgi:hypothetical protein